VLLGSTTECFQPIEKKYNLTRRILEILNRHQVYYVILTRSPLITECTSLLSAGFCTKIYFTVNKYDKQFKQRLEPKSPAFTLRDKAINLLLAQGLPVIPYFSPMLPWISKVKNVFGKYPLAQAVEFECLNFTLAHITEIISALSEENPGLRQKYLRMTHDRRYYYRVWDELKKKLTILSKAADKTFNIYIHDFKEYFKNRYM